MNSVQRIFATDVVELADLAKGIFIDREEHLLMLLRSEKPKHIVQVSHMLDVNRYLSRDVSMSHKHGLITKRL